MQERRPSVRGAQLGLNFPRLETAAGQQDGAGPAQCAVALPNQWRSDWDGQHSGLGIPLNLPTLRSLQNGGTRFTEAYVPSPSCAPSRASLSSGREYDRNGVLGNDANDYDSRIPTYYSALQEAGYWTMTAGRDDLTKHSWLGYRLGQDASNGLYRMTELGFSDGIRCIGKIENLHLWPQPFGTCTRLELLTLLIGVRPAHLGTFLGSRAQSHMAATWPNRRCRFRMAPT